jgi:hypothetical protein
MKIKLLLCLLFFQSSLLASSVDELQKKSLFYMKQNELEEVRKKLTADLGKGYIASYRAKRELSQLSDLQEKFDKVQSRRKQLTCSSVDLRNESLGEVRNQGSIGWCFAYATADLLSYELGEQVSARNVAQNYHHKREADTAEEFIEGGSIKAAADSSMEFGVCKESDMPSNNKMRYSANDSSYSFKDIFLELERLKEVQEDQITEATIKPVLRPWAFKAYQKLFSNADDYKVSPVCDTYYLLKEIFPTITVDSVRKVIAKNSFDEYTDTLFEELCPTSGRLKQQIPIDEKWIDKDSVDDQFDALDKINALLDGKNGDAQIIGIAYAGKMISKKDHTYTGVSHASTIVGRKTDPITGECKYLVRNTWGNTYKRSLDDENGNIWVSRDELMENVGAITFVKK